MERNVSEEKYKWGETKVGRNTSVEKRRWGETKVRRNTSDEKCKVMGMARLWGEMVLVEKDVRGVMG